MSDMYPWDSASQGDYPPEPLRSRRGRKTRETPAQAVQIALDRRDNGGDAVPAARSATPPAVPAARSATPPAASLTRQP